MSDKFVYPLPEVAEGKRGRGWSIRPLDGGDPAAMVNSCKREVVVPLDGTPRAAYTRAHEVAHVLISPMKGADNIVVVAAEDIRVNMFLNRAGIELPSGYPRFQASGNLALDFLKAASVIGRADDGITGAAFRREYPGERTAVYTETASKLRRLFGGKLTFAKTLAAAKIIMDALTQLGLSLPPPPKAVSTSKLAALMARLKMTPALAHYMINLSSRSANWGTMTIDEVPRPKRTREAHRVLQRDRRVRGADEGDMLRYPDKYCTDKRVFGVKRAGRARAISILIDCSGSMHLSIDKLQPFLDKAPGTLVAGYGSTDQADTKGVLRILARKGRRVKDEDVAPNSFTCGGNVVDLPALKWLARQPGRKFWISDGCVTECGDCMTNAALREVKTFMQEHPEITRVRTLDALMAKPERQKA